MSRTLIDGTIVEEYEYAIDLVIHTKCPKKWKLIDMETSQEYIGAKTIKNQNLNFLKWIREGLKPKIAIHYGSWEKINKELKK